MSLLEIHGLTHSFGDNVLYKDAELLLNKSERLGIVGQNGSGKVLWLRFAQSKFYLTKAY